MGWKVPDSLEAEVCRRIGLDPAAVGVTANQTTLVLLVYKTREEIIIPVEDCIASKIPYSVYDNKGRLKSQAPGSA